MAKKGDAKERNSLKTRKSTGSLSDERSIKSASRRSNGSGAMIEILGTFEGISIARKKRSSAQVLSVPFMELEVPQSIPLQ